MLLDTEADLIREGIINVRMISEGSRSTIYINFRNGDVLRQELPSNFRDLDQENLNTFVEKMVDKRKRRQKIEKIISKI